MRSPTIVPLFCLVLTVATSGLTACGDTAGSNDTNGDFDGLTLIDLYLPSDVPGGDTAGNADTPGGDMVGDEGADEGPPVTCKTGDDCPQPANTCEHLSCHPTKKVCVRDNSAHSGMPCDDGHACTADDYCQSGVCVYTEATCEDCGDGACFFAGETCRDCPGDCGSCPPNETDCQDGKDEDADGMTDCDDKDCESDARCAGWWCVSSVPDGFLACGEAKLDQPKGLRVIDPACGVEVGNRAWIYQFYSSADRTVTVRIASENAGESFRLFVMEGSCNPETCIGVSDNTAEVTFEARQDWKYYLMIDKVGTGSGGVTTSVICE